jgi:alkyl hydroperoxide reductase subunit AhpC
MFTGVGFPAPHLAGDAFVRGAGRHSVVLSGYRGSWVVLSLGVRHLDVLELAELEEAFAADGAVLVAATSDDWAEVSSRYADEPVRFPILTGVSDSRRITAIVDPNGIIRHLSLCRTARETLASLEALLIPRAQAA